jgi:hypothetical protein
MAQQTMKAVVFDGPHKVSVQDRPVPKRESHPGGHGSLADTYHTRSRQSTVHCEFFFFFNSFLPMLI